jgi:hypothetical protein
VKAFAASTAGLVSAAAAVGLPALVGLAVLAVMVIGVLCWIIANSSRTENTVALITAARPLDPSPRKEGPRNPGSQRRRRQQQ